MAQHGMASLVNRMPTRAYKQIHEPATMAAMKTVEPTDRTRLRRLAKRGVFDRQAIDAILDEGLVCTLSFLDDQGRPGSIPTGYARDGDRLLLHGSSRNASLLALIGKPASISVTLLDGIVLARSVFNHSFNYRSVVLYGEGAEISDPVEKLQALECVVENVVRGRWTDARLPTAAELKATLVVAFPIDEVSAKVRTGPPGDEPEDVKLPHWSGVIPCETVWQAPEPAPNLADGIVMPHYVQGYRRAI